MYYIRPNPNRRTTTTRSPEKFLQQLERQRWKYNLIGLMALILIIILATDAGGWARRLESLLTGR